jgi:hypothetical protein
MTHSKFRRILSFPARNVKTFPDRETNWPATYPALIKPWIGGVRAYWLDDQQAFQLQDGDIVRVDGIEPFVPDDLFDQPAPNLLGEFWEKNVIYETTLEHVLYNQPTPNLDFYVFDAELDMPAVDRATYCYNIPRQFERHTRIAEAYQVNTPGGFRNFLDGWRRSYLGALAVGYQDPFLATEYEVKTLVAPP